MNIFRKFGAVAFFLIAIFAFAACKADISENISIETVFPENSSGVFVLDHSDGDQIEKLEDLKSQFPEIDAWEKVIGFVDEEFSDKDISYEKDLKPIFEDEWQFGFSVTVPENFGEVEEGEPAVDLGLLFAGKFSEADEVQELMETLMKRKVYIYKEDGDFQYWTKEDDKFYMARYGELIFVTNTEENRAAAVARITAGSGGFVPDKTKIAEAGLGYMFVSGKVLFEAYDKFFGELYSYVGVDEELKNQFSALGDIYGTFAADKDGISIDSSVDVDEEAGDISGIVRNTDYRINFPEKVNGKGVFFYSEQSSLALYLKSFVNSFMSGFNAAKDPLIFAEGEGAIETVSRDYYAEFLASLEGLTGASGEELEGLFEAPVAVALSDSGGFIPTFSFYFQFDPEQAEIAKKLTQALDIYMDKVIAEFDALMVDAGVATGALKKDLELVNGGGLHRLYLDWNALPEETLAQANLIPGLNLTEQKIEVYYGVTGDDVFVLSLYPDFPESYGVDVLAYDANFKEAFEKVDGQHSAYQLDYFATAPLFDIADRYLEALKASGFLPLSGEDLANYELYGKQLVGTFRYFVDSARYENGVLGSKGYVRIKKVGK